MAIKKRTVKSKKSAVKKTAMKKAPGRGRPKAATKKAPVKKAATKKATTKKATTKKAVAKRPVKKTVKKKVAKRVAKGNPAVERAKALRAELADVKAKLKASMKREAGLAKLLGNMEKSVAGMVKKELYSLEKALKGKPRKRRAKKSAKS